MASQTTQCPHCGRENRAGAGYCAWCGGVLPAARASETAADQPPASAMPPPTEPDAEATGQPPQQERAADAPQPMAMPDAAAPEVPRAASARDRGGAEEASSAPALEGDTTDEGALEATPDERRAGRPTVKLIEPEVADMPASEAEAAPEAEPAPVNRTPLEPGTVLAGRYELLVDWVLADVYGINRVEVDGRPIGEPFDAYAPGVFALGYVVPVGEVTLGPGEHTITVRVVGKNEKATNTIISVRRFLLRPLD